MRSTKTLPTTIPSATSFTEDAEAASLIPQPIAIGRSVCNLSSLTLSLTSSASKFAAPVMP